MSERWRGSGGEGTASIVQQDGDPTSAFAVFQHGKPAPAHVIDRLVHLLNAGSAVLGEATREPTYRAGAENTAYRGIHPVDEATRETQ